MAAVITEHEEVATDELVALFVGGDGTSACPHLNLVVAICERERPRSSKAAMLILYPRRSAAPNTTVERVIEWGYELWLQRVHDRDPEEWRRLTAPREP
jgi:hypothetical protein